MSIRLRHIAAINPPTPEFELLPDSAELPFLPLEAVWPGHHLDMTRRQPKTSVSSGYTKFREGDILLPKITPTFQADRTVIANGLEGGIGAGTTELHVVRAGPDAEVRYLRYLLSSKEFLDEGEASMIGVAGQKRVPDDCLRDLAVPVVDLRHQRAIADYLDRETARIDALIEAEKRRIALAGERLTATTEHAVLGHLDTNARQNDPNGPVLPAPEDWSVRRNKTFMREVIELSESGDEELLTVSHLTSVTPRSEKDVTMFLAESNAGYKRVGVGDLVINTMWAWMGALGVSAYKGIVSPAYGVYRFTDCNANPRYFDSLFRCPAYVAEMTRYSKGVWISRLRLYPDSFLALRTPFPAAHEQARIADQVHELRRGTNELVTLLERSIILLQERRQALITAAVTGEMHVPGAAA